ncbi:MAG: hypothetical protein K9M45_08745 [Kiritimatiellales bacterium]|nr:hypothetical protein [Kiritimatiellales bacterium]
MKLFSVFTCIAVAAMILAGGCSKQGGGSVMDDMNATVKEVAAKIESFDVKKLEKAADQYKTAIVAKTEEIQSIAAKVKDIPVTELLGDEAKVLKVQLEEAKEYLADLKARYQVYLDKLKAMGVDLGKYGL